MMRKSTFAVAALPNRRTVAAGLAAMVFHVRRAHAADGIDYWHHLTSQSEFAGLRAVLALFGGAEPGMEVHADAIPNPDFMTKFTAAALARALPDVTMLSTERLDDMVGLGGLCDITDRVAAWPRRADFPPDRWTGASREGRIYGVPAYAFVDWLYYRRDWFEEAGLAEPPATLEALRQAALRLTDRSRGRFGFGLRGGAGGAKLVIDMLAAFGSPPIRDGVIGLDRAAAVEAIRFYSGLATQDHVTPPSAAGDGYRQVMEAFRAGRTAMVLHHTGSLREITASLRAETEVATAMVPAGPAERVARVSYLYHGIANPRRADAAWDFASFWGEDAPGRVFHAATGFFPASLSLAAAEDIGGDPLYAAARETLRIGCPPPAFPGLPGWADTVVLPAFQSVLTDRITAEAAVDEMQRGLDAATAGRP